MIEDLQDLQCQFKVIKTEADSLLDGLSDAQLNWHPSAREWSIGECIEHLVVIGRGALSRIDEVMADSRVRGLLSEGPFKYGLLERWIVRLAENPLRRKFKAPKGYTPSTDLAYGEVVPHFFVVQNEFIASIDRANGIDLSKSKVPNPVTRWFTLSLGQYLALHAAHERRHLRQARHIKGHPRFVLPA